MPSPADEFLASIDRQVFTTTPYAKEVTKPWGSETHLAPEGQPYMMKIIRINAGQRLSLQAHDLKTETYTLLHGRAAVVLENAEGELEQIELQPGQGLTSQIGQRHRLVGITDCAVVEASTPEIGTTFRLEDDFKRPDETEDVRNQPGRGWTGSDEPTA